MKEGWLCPRCGRINAPFAMYCDCKNVDVTTGIDISECIKDWLLDTLGISTAIEYRCRRCGVKHNA